MRMVITGAAGFVGQAVTQAALAADRASQLRLVDRVAPQQVDPRCEVLAADLGDATIWESILDGADALIHLAALPSGASETDPAQSLRINLQANLNLLRALQGKPIRLVYASSIAALGSRLTGTVDERTRPVPDLTYGTHKLMSELAITDALRRGLIDAVAVRLPGIVARPRSAGGFRSGFLSDMFWKLRAGEPIALPVSAAGTSWLLSRPLCAANLLQAVANQAPLAVVNMPALRVTIGEMIAEICRQTGADPALVRYEPDPVIEGKFAAYPPLDSKIAQSMGMRHDADVKALVSTSLAGLG